MVLELSTRSHFPDETVKDIVKAALRNEAELADLRHKQFAKECRIFEEKFGMTTEDFLAKYEAGELGDSEEYLDWFASAHGRQIWRQKAEVLGEVAV